MSDIKTTSCEVCPELRKQHCPCCDKMIGVCNYKKEILYGDLTKQPRCVHKNRIKTIMKKMGANEEAAILMSRALG